jgi:hypothetical protein
MLVELTDPAAEEVIHASVTYELERPGLGFLFDEEFDAAIERIAQRPLQYPEISPAVRRALLRVFSYSVYFTIVDDVSESLRCSGTFLRSGGSRERSRR